MIKKNGPMEFNEVIGEPVLVPGCLHIKETYWNLSKHQCQRPSNLKRAKMFPFHPVSCSAPGLNIACGSLLTESSCHMHRSIVFSFIHEVDVTLSYIRCWPIYIVTTWNNNGRITLFSNFMVHAIWIKYWNWQCQHIQYTYQYTTMDTPVPPQTLKLCHGTRLVSH